MIGIIFVAVTIVSLIFFYVLISTTLFNFAIKRDKINEISYEKLVAQGLEKYADEIISSRNEFLKRDFKTVSIKSFDGLTLNGLLYEAPNPKGTIVLFHGYRSSPDIDFCVAEKFYETLNLNVLMPYQRAHGLSEGKYITFGIKEQHDVISWVEFINNVYGYQLPLFLSGLSMGSSTVLMSAKFKHPDNVKMIIADCGFTSPYEIFKHVVKATMKIPFKLFIPLFNRLSKKKAGFSVYDDSTVESVKKATVPIFFIHGEADKFVPSIMTDENYEACTTEKHLLKVKDAPHAVSFMFEREKYQEMLAELIVKYL